MSLICVFGALLVVALAAKLDAPGPGQDQVRILRTPSGVRFGLLGERGTAPAPTLFVFGDNLEDTLTKDDHNEVGHILGRDGYLSVSLDAPCHGKDAAPGQERYALKCWRERIENGDSLLPEFIAKVSAVLDYMIKEGYTDPSKVAASGSSRGAFIALHFAAADPRVKCVAAFAPLTNLLTLTEFSGLKEDLIAMRGIRALQLINSAEKLAGRSIWVCIGNYDQRVGTDDAIAFTRRVVEASIVQDKPVNVEIHVVPPFGYQVPPYGNGHMIPTELAHEEAAVWIHARMREGN